MTGSLTIENLKRFDRNPVTQALRAAVLVSRAVAKKTRADVDAYTMPAFHGFGFVDAETGKPLKHWSDLYLSHQDATAFYAACDDLNRAHGYDLPAGYCPALVAEHAVIKAENALLKHAGSCLGIDFECACLDIRRDALALFLDPPRASAAKLPRRTRRTR